MGTKALGTGTKNLSVNMPIELAEDLKQLASESGMSFSAYAKMILEEAATSKVQYRTIKTHDQLAAESQSGYGKKKTRQPMPGDSLPPKKNGA